MRALMICLVVMLSVASAHAERRVALVIGNSDYQHVTELKNPYNDAKDMTQKLKELEFEVVEGVDLDLRILRQL
ncbi:MAG: caspase family protein [Roseibium sp.]|uniref:caspase family protein n=1 Tax=Roseibium sp. TaxID=1936156 RepID=UPI00261138C6|nr:caspase family protein [Roseibium sp.]MCV0428363.1 caspase family protein [Roseibium sp.]